MGLLLQQTLTEIRGRFTLVLEILVVLGDQCLHLFRVHIEGFLLMELKIMVGAELLFRAVPFQVPRLGTVLGISQRFLVVLEGRLAVSALFDL